MMDFKDFYAGSEYSAYTFLGAHKSDAGFVFRVYAPAAVSVSVIGAFSSWEEIPMQRIYDGQFWETEVPGARPGQMYKFRIHKKDGTSIDHADPYAFCSELRPGTASVLTELPGSWTDGAWMKARTDRKDAPLNIYEVHAGSWKRKTPWNGKEDPSLGWLTYAELSERLIPYLLEHHYDCLELMPLAEYPADESWGYQQTGFFSATSRYGSPEDLCRLVDECHRNGISVILDVVTVHFAVNDYALWNFDGTALYEYPHPAVGYSEWGSCNFMHSRGDVRSFLQSSCAFWLDVFHFDGLRFDAVGNLIYWQGNASRGVNADAVRFLQHMNAGLKRLFPTAMLIAEDSTPYAGTTKPAEEDGLGFDYKWDLGWMNDTLRFFGKDPAQRSGHLGELAFSMDYFRSNRYLLPLSHDEVVHGKGTIVEKMYGDFETRLQEARLLYFYMYMHPGKKLNFMGNELALTREWDERRELDWDSLKDKAHADFAAFMTRLCAFYEETPALWKEDYDDGSFHWICRGEDGRGIAAFGRRAGDERLVAVMNFTDRPLLFESPVLRQAEAVFDTHAEMPGVPAGASLRLLPFQGLAFLLS